MIKKAIRQGIYVGAALSCVITWIASELTTPRVFETAAVILLVTGILSLIDRP